MTLFNELTRRKVFKVGVAYLVVAWLLTQMIYFQSLTSVHYFFKGAI